MARIAALGTAALLALSLPARADGPAPSADVLAEARRLQAELEYERALAAVEAAIARGGAAPGRLADLHELAGELAAGLDRAAVAEDHFARALALRPTTTLPPGTSPRLAGPFAAARARGVPALQVATSARQGLVTLDAGADPLGLVVGITAHVVDARGAHAELTERGALRVVVPADATIVEVSALDAAGNRVWVGAPVAAPGPPRVVAPPTGTAPPPTAPRARWAPWAIGSGVALLGAAACSWETHSAQGDWDQLRAMAHPSYSDLAAIETRGRRWALAANVGFGVAAAGAVVTALVWWRGRDDAPGLAPSVAITPSGASLTIAGGF